MIGCACLLIAQKIEEIYPCDIYDMVYISDNTYTCEDLNKMEMEILKTLDMEICFPITTNFMSFYAKKLNLSQDQILEVRFVLAYISFSLDLMKYHPSVLALCACMHVDNNYLNNNSCEVTECMGKMENWLKQDIKNDLPRIIYGLETFFKYKKYKYILNKYITK
jgi:cyclin B